MCRIRVVPRIMLRLLPEAAVDYLNQVIAAFGGEVLSVDVAYP